MRKLKLRVFGLLTVVFACSHLMAQSEVQQLQQQLKLLEENSGTFSEEIGETAFQLGRLYEASGQHQLALEAFQQADQHIKIASGLYAPEREAAIREIFEQSVRLGNWKDANEAMTSLGWLNARNMDATSPDYLPTRKLLANWYLASEFYRLDDNPLALLRNAHEQLAESTTASEGLDRLADLEMLQLYLATNYRISQHAPQGGPGDLQMRLLAMERNLELEISRAVSSCYAMFSESPGRARACSIQAEQTVRSRSPLNDPFFMNELEEQLYGDRFAMDAMRRGTNASRAWLERAEAEGTPQELLDALLLFADWNITMDRFSAAEDAYLRAWELANELDVLEQYGFDQPRPLNGWGLSESFSEVAKLIDTSPEIIGLGMRVTARGKAEDVSVLEKPEDSETRIARFAQRFESIRFRPALEMGVPVVTPRLRMNLPLLD